MVDPPVAHIDITCLKCKERLEVYVMGNNNVDKYASKAAKVMQDHLDSLCRTGKFE